MITLIWVLFPPPAFPSHATFTFRLASVWIIAFADDLAVICPSAVRLSRCLTRIRDALRRLRLEISLKKTEVVTFATGPRRARFTVRIGETIVAPAMSFKYLGVTISAGGQLQTHQRAILSRAKVSAYEVGKLMKRLDITNIGRLTSYMQAFVDSQFYGLELLPMHVARDIDIARKLFVCTCFNLPTSTSRNLTYALFPVLPAMYMLIKRRAVFYKRALNHDLSCVQEAFLFDMCQLYPHHLSWTLQLTQMFQAIGVDFTHDIASYPRHLDLFHETMTDPDLVSFIFIQNSDDKTLSFFRLMPDARVSASFRAFLSRRQAACQCFLLLFLTSGLRWRFFKETRRGSSCPKCGTRFWSWEHFLSCPCFPVRVSVPEFVAMVVLGAWDEILTHIRRVCILWLESFDASLLGISCSDVSGLS